MKVCVIGLGTIGEPAAKHIQLQGIDVIGYDIKTKNIENLQTFTDWKQVPPCKIYVITVGSLFVDDACKLVAQTNIDALVLIESTVQVGTCRKLSKKHGLPHIVHCPHRYWAENPEEHGIKQLRIIGGLDPTSLGQAAMFYMQQEISVFGCSSIEVAELTKIAENSYRFVEIAFSEELKMICEKHGVSFDELRQSCNTKWNIELLEAREGIGGVCLPQDIGFLSQLSNPSSLLNGAILADKEYKQRENK